MRKYEIISNYEEEGYSMVIDVIFQRRREGVFSSLDCLDEYNMIVIIDFPMWYK